MEGKPAPGRRARHWPYVVTGIVFAGVMGWISYTDALFVTRLAGNDGGIAYAYPTLPDGLLFFSLLALTEAARAGAHRPWWATAGLVLGAVMTLAANAGAGLGHSVLDAVIDGLVPVCFFICVEIVLWHLRHGRRPAPVSVPVGVPVKPPLPSVREVRDDHGCGPATEKKIRRALRARDAQWTVALDRSRGGIPPAVPVAQSPAAHPTEGSRAAAGKDRGALGRSVPVPSSNGHLRG